MIMHKRKCVKKCIRILFAAIIVVTGIQLPAAAQEANVTKNGVIYTAPESSFDASRPSSRNSVLAPRAIQLQYQDDELDNGTILATWETSVVELLPERQGKFFPIYESQDYGVNWEEVGRVVETQRQDWDGNWQIENCPHIFELPADVGEMKKGGIVAFGDVCPRDLSQTCLDMYYSADLGRTWEFVSSVVTDSGANYMGATPGPVWEPYILYDPEMKALVCYYSDEREEKYGQKLVLQYTTDGKNWSEVIDVVAQADTNMRPGMPIVTQMENGYYVMVFEGVGLNYSGQGIPCNYKISMYPDDPIHWEAGDIGFTYGYGGSPYCTTLPDGHIAMTCSDNSEVFINTQKDLSGEFIKYPTGVPVGYNRQLIPLDDGTPKGSLLTLSCEFPDTGKANSIKWGKLDLNTVTIPDTKPVRYQISTDTKNMADIWPQEGTVIAGADQYFSVEPRMGCTVQKVFVNGVEADLQKSWVKVPKTDSDLHITVEATGPDENARFIRSKEDTQYYLCLPGYSMQDGREVFEWTWEDHPNFNWIFEAGEKEGTYQIRHKNSGMYLAAKDVELAEKANVIQTTVLDDKALWKITEVEDGCYSIINYSSNLAITRGKPGDFGYPTERFAVQKPYEGTDDQLWEISYVLESEKIHPITVKGTKNGTVTTSFSKELSGADVYVTVMPDEGYKLAENGLKINGKALTGTSFVMPDEDVVVTASFIKDLSGGLPFEDVDPVTGEWYYDAVCYNFEREIIKGTDETHFEPFSNLARAQFAIILHRMNDAVRMDYRADFADVEEGAWYTDAILWASRNKIVTGYTDGSRCFGPADQILREQMAVMMYRYAGFKGYDVSESATFDDFTDAANVSDYAKEAMKWAVGSKIITGKDNETKLDPQGSASRAECAIIVQRFLEKYEK